MFRRITPRLGVFSTLITELKKLGPVLSYELDETRNRAIHLGKVMQGTDGTPEEIEKERKHKETYQQVLAQQAAKNNEEYQRKLAQHQSLASRLRFQLNDAMENMKSFTSKNSGVMAVVQHCLASHTAEVAVEEGIDVKNVQLVLEKTAANAAVGANEQVVGYIDAPNASDEQVLQFAYKLQKACPAANTMGSRIEWRKKPATYPSGGDEFESDLSRGTIDHRQVTSPSSPLSTAAEDGAAGGSAATSGASVNTDVPTSGTASQESNVPNPSSTEELIRGMPGARRRFDEVKPKKGKFQL